MASPADNFGSHANAKVRADDRRGAPAGKGTVEANGGRIGNPPFVPTAEQRRDVEAWVKAGLTALDCADLLDISESTFRRHFAREWKIERIKIKLAIASKLVTMALKGDKTCMIFWLRTQGKWTTRVEVTGEGGGPVRMLDLTPYLEKMDEAQLDAIEPILAALLAEGGANLDFRDQLGPATGAVIPGEAEG